MDRSYNRMLVTEYAKRVVSVCFDKPNAFYVFGTQFQFKAVKCPVIGETLLKAKIVFPDETTDGSERLVLLITGHKPFKDIPFNRNGQLETQIKWFRLNTRLAIRYPNKRRRKYLQEKKHLSEQLELI